MTVRTETAPSGALREPVRVRFVVYGAGPVGGVNEGTALIIIANGLRLLLPVHQQQTEISDYTTAVPYDEPDTATPVASRDVWPCRRKTIRLR